MALINSKPTVPPEVLAAKVGEFNLESAGNVTGSFFGGQFRSMDNVYVAEASGERRGVIYNVFEHRSAETASDRVKSGCDKNGTVTDLKDKQGAVVGRMCEEGNSVTLNVGRYYAWTRIGNSYDLTKAKAKEATRASLNTFVHALPIATNVAFPESPYRKKTQRERFCPIVKPNSQTSFRVAVRPVPSLPRRVGDPFGRAAIWDSLNGSTKFSDLPKGLLRVSMTALQLSFLTNPAICNNLTSRTRTR